MNRYKFRKIFALFLALSMSASALFGCNGGADQNFETDAVETKAPETKPDTTVDSIGEIEELECDKDVKAAMLALLGGDTAELETLCGHTSGMLADYAQLEFGSFKVATSDDGNAMLSVDVQSSLDTVRSGLHRYEFIKTASGVSMRDTTVTASHEETAITKFIDTWLASPFFDYNIKLPAEVTAVDMLLYSTAIYDLLYHLHGPLPYANYYDYAVSTFGLWNDSGYVGAFGEDAADLPEHKLEHAVSTYYYTYAELGEDYVTVQFYADQNCSIKSHLVKYSFAEGETAIPSSSEIIFHATYEPLRSVA